MIIVLFVSIIVVALMKIVSLFTDQLNHLYFIVPIATGVLLLKLLIFERLSIIFAIIFSVLGSIIFNGEVPGSLNMEAGIYFLFFQIAAIVFLYNLKYWVFIIKSVYCIIIIMYF